MDTPNVTYYCGHLTPYMMHITLTAMEWTCGERVSTAGAFHCSPGPHRRREKKLVTACLPDGRRRYTGSSDAVAPYRCPIFGKGQPHAKHDGGPPFSSTIRMNDAPMSMGVPSSPPASST